MKNMLVKRMTSIALGAMILASVAGCGKAENTASVQEDATPVAEETADVVGDEGMMEDYPDNFMEERTNQFVFDSYDEVIANLQDGEAYGYAKVWGADEEVLFITNETFDGYGFPATMTAYPYLKNANGQYECGSIVSTDSTATPIAVDEKGQIYEATHTSLTKMAVDKDLKGLMVVEYYAVEWGEDEDSNVYSGFVRNTNSVNEDETQLEADDSDSFWKAFEDLEQASPIEFTVIGEASAE